MQCKWSTTDVQEDDPDSGDKRKRSGSVGGESVSERPRKQVSRKNLGDARVPPVQDAPVIDSGDYNFDASFVGAYSDSAHLSSATTDLIGAALEVERHAANGSAPLLSSPNCE